MILPGRAPTASLTTWKEPTKEEFAGVDHEDSRSKESKDQDHPICGRIDAWIEDGVGCIGLKPMPEISAFQHIVA